MVDGAVLVLNQNYEPLNVCNAKRAFVLVDRGKAEVLEHSENILRSPRYTFQLPSVIRLIYFIKRPRPQLRLSRRDVLQRDGHTCQYCGAQSRDLTLDHVVPRRIGGKHVWENLVAACKHCNHRKGSRTPDEARMRLLRRPFRPYVPTHYIFRNHLEMREGWRKFVLGWEGHSGAG
jgi:5-methylcytosine-specific restriction endonuclease McrA